jgi:hypothetical protein
VGAAWWLPVVVVWLTLGVGQRAGFREDELECEEAAAHLSACCNAALDLSCTFVDDSCDSIYPDLSPSESRCIRDLSCSEIRARGLCSEQFSDYVNRDAGTPPVCE